MSAHEADIDAIKQVIAVVEHAQNNEDPDEFLALFRADAIWTTGGGKRLFGLDEIAAFTRQVLPGGMQGSSVTFELEHVLFIRPDVAAVKVRQSYETADGRDVDEFDDFCDHLIVRDDATGAGTVRPSPVSTTRSTAIRTARSTTTSGSCSTAPGNDRGISVPSAR